MSFESILGGPSKIVNAKANIKFEWLKKLKEKRSTSTSEKIFYTHINIF